MVVAICAVAAHARLGDIEVVGDLVIPSPTVPTSPTDTGTAGQIAWDINYIYVCTSTNNWIRCPKDSSWVVVAEDVVYAGEDVIFIMVAAMSTVALADLTATEGLAMDLTSGGAGTTLTFAFDPTELLGSRTFGDASTDTIVWTWNRATGTDPTLTFGNALLTFNSGITTSLDLIVSGGDITLGSASIFSGGDTASLNNIDALNATTETTIEAAIDTLSNLTAASSLVTVGTIGSGVWNAGAVTSSGAITAAGGMDLGTSQALVGTTAMTVGDNSQTIAINSSDWDIGATGIITGVGNITSDGTVEGATLTEGGNAVYSSGETPGGELGGTFASFTIDDGVSVSSWTLTTPTITSGATFTDADISPDAAGELVYDNTVTGLLDGAFAWYDDDAVRYFVDLATLPSDDDYVVAYDADADGFYMKSDATGAGGSAIVYDLGDDEINESTDVDEFSVINDTDSAWSEPDNDEIQFNGTSLLYESELASEADLETQLGAIDVIVSTEIDTYGELDTLVADKEILSEDSNSTLTNKTFSASGTGNVVSNINENHCANNSDLVRSARIGHKRRRWDSGWIHRSSFRVQYHTM
jgi:hypothetical protein